MHDLYDVVRQLTANDAPREGATALLGAFADGLGWRPSDRLDLPELGEYANAHLVVEHGLENTAVISFFRTPWRFAELNYSSQQHLLGVSYNNLVDWHIQVQADEVDFIYNRTTPAKVVGQYKIDPRNYNGLTSDTFEKISGLRQTPNVPALDTALISTISDWKRRLSAELGCSVSNESLSALFNTLIFVRAVEDHRRRSGGGIRVGQSGTSWALSERWSSGTHSPSTLREALTEGLRQWIVGSFPHYLVQADQLAVFDHLDHDTVEELLRDFYRNRFAPYEYDFSLMSKHALSRIYEHYVSLLQIDRRAQVQLELFPRLPDEERNRSYGSVYTPQFIARFFARYLRDQMPLSSFRRLRSADPACGSGIFLRTLLELQCEELRGVAPPEELRPLFQETVGLDVDENACQAARLSLALLHLVNFGELPETLGIQSTEAVLYHQEHPELAGSMDAVLANPPFVHLELQLPEIKDRIKRYMEGVASGRIDTYLAFLRVGLEMLRPGGYALYVLPHNFLIAENAKGMRSYVADHCWIRCLADLSAIRVFESADTYVILLILQKKVAELPAPAATIVRCQDYVSKALQDAAEGRRTENSAYSIYDVEQTAFRGSQWVIVPPQESAIERRMQGLPTIERFFDVRLGFISGSDDVFIVDAKQLLTLDRGLFVPYLPDRIMGIYTVPRDSGKYVFYPFIDGKRIQESDLQHSFTSTWRYLEAHRPTLEARAAVRRGQIPWWQPERPRTPDVMLRPKIVSPHVVLVPRFALDIDGKYAISHAPFLVPKDETATDETLRFYVAVLNSTAAYWFINNHSHTYSRGYSRLECQTLRRTPVPDMRTVSAVERRRLLHLVEQRLSGEGDVFEIESRIDRIVAEFYGLSDDDRRAIGMES